MLTTLRADLADLGAVRTVPYRASEPIGVAELSVLADALYGRSDALAAQNDSRAHQTEVVLESGAGLESVYLWRIPLPLVQESSVQLGRIDDDLLVTVADERRRMALPAVLRRCTVVDAELVADGLRVCFRPDPAVWMR